MKNADSGYKDDIKHSESLNHNMHTGSGESIKHIVEMGQMENAGLDTSLDYVIIGNSAAGVAAAESIRRIDKKSKISIFTDEKYLNYSKPLITYFLVGQTGY